MRATNIVYCAPSDETAWRINLPLRSRHNLFLEVRLTAWNFQERDCPAIPHDTDFDIPSKFMLTHKGEDFLLEDSTITQSGKRYLMFATNKNIEMLKEHPNWFVDGTFKSCPEIFYQIYTVHCLVQGSTFPCIYALLSNKRQDTYETFWKNIATELNPMSVMMDLKWPQ